ncbi:MAG: CBS domain-containing protein [Clostridia bacterium]|nr:CBS domain-containing protein [Clostridia bacterium]
MKIKDIIGEDAPTVSQTDTIENALKIMTEKNINGLAVVDDDNLLVGMVVKADIYRFMIQPGRYTAYPVDRVMSKDVVSVHPDENVREAAVKILANHIVAMPVVEEDRVLGMVSVEDLLEYFSKEA